MISKLLLKSYKSVFFFKIEFQGLSKVCKFINALNIFINDPLRHPSKTGGKKTAENIFVYFNTDKS